MKRNELFDKCVANCDPATMAEVNREVDLKKAADNHIHKVVDAAGHPGWDWETKDVVDAFKAGADWQKEQMMKEAVEGVVVELGETYKDQSISVDAKELNQVLQPLRLEAGGTVKIIIIKED